MNDHLSSRSATSSAPTRWRHALAAAMACLGVASALADISIPSVPLAVRQTAKPMVMLAASKEHRLFYEAYNDASDIDGDGTLDIRFKPAITYLGLFNPDLCYAHNGLSDTQGLFTPQASAAAPGRTCNGQWSGNWLNYITTSRMDALRVVLYGGQREVDTASQTILRRAYIPQDGHSWAKEYTSEAVDGYRISDYTPLSAPNGGQRHFFGNLTRAAGVSCANLNDCSGRPPLLSVVLNSNKRVWEWASSEAPVLGTRNLQDGSSPHGGTLSEYTVRVAACATGYTNGCKQYGSTFKPVGLLQEFGENDTVLFGLMTGSYDRNLSGGRLRKPVGPFREEINATDGTFKSTAPLVKTLDALRIRDFNNGRTNNTYPGERADGGFPAEGVFPDWGNPVGEMMYEALRYFAGKKVPTPDFSESTTVDAQVGLVTPPWDDPYDPQNSQARAPICARASLLVVSDTNVSYDSDQVPGAYEAFLKRRFTGDLSGLDALAETRAISTAEGGFPGDYFIGQSGTTFDTAPTAKRAASLGEIRGLAPEEPTKQGSYHAAAVARYGKRTDLRADLTGRQNVETFVVALASPLLRIVVPIAGGRQITLVPFAKSVGGGSGRISADAGRFQPTNQIVDFYVETIANSGPGDADPAVNGGRYFAQFRINYEDTEQGSDHDMDAIAQYTLQYNADDTLTVTVRPVYQGGGIRHRIGYVISGTGADGVYLEVQDEADETLYFLNTPPGTKPGDCAKDVRSRPSTCSRLPYLGGPTGMNQATRVFQPGSTPAATVLKDPLWYAAKWGGYTDRNGNEQPDLPAEWDADGDGTPDAYLPVQNPLKLQQALRKALNTIVARASTASSLASNSTSASAGTLLYQALFDTSRWSGDLLAWNVSRDSLSRVPAWRASTALPPWQDRKIFIGRSSGQGVDSLDALSLPQTGAGVIDYLRGDRSGERQNGGTLRDRNSPLGAIIHSSPLYVRDTQTVYVGASDGMLHAFDALSGREHFAVIPRAAASRVAAQATLDYAHAYQVDGELARAPRGPLTDDRSYLYALLGRGGKGLFSLNITAPASFGTHDFLWEYSAAEGNAGASDRDLGLMLGQAVVAPLNNGKLGVIVGNGYNSSSGKAVLYVFSVNPDGSLARIDKIDTGVAADNGLGPPAALDTNNDGKVDLIYAGDLQGNVWKFDLGSSDPGNWFIAYDRRPMFQARSPQASTAPRGSAPTARQQPITAPLLAVVNDQPGDPHRGKRFVFFGTGAYLRDTDPGDTSVQTWYGLIDEGVTPILADRSELVARPVQATGEVAGRVARVFASATAGDMAGKRGWYIDLTAPRAGERIITAPRIALLAVPALMVTSIDPASSDPCVPGGRGFLSLVDPYTGGGLTVGLIDAQGNGNFNDDLLMNKQIGSIELRVGLPSAPALIRRSQGVTTAFVAGSASGDPQTTGTGVGIQSTGFKSRPSSAKRISWREIIRD